MATWSVRSFRLLASTGAVVGSLALTAPAANAAELTAFWKDGPRLATTDGTVEIAIGGRAMVDAAFFSDGDLGPALGSGNGTEIRRARLAVSGTLYERVIFKTQYDFAGGDVDIKDMFVGVKKVPGVGAITVGHQYEPFGLEEQTSSKYITFLERSLVSSFVPSRNTGLRLQNNFADERLQAAVGVFRDTDNYADGQGTGDWGLTARMSGLPYRNGDDFVHVGAAYSYRVADELDVSARPEAHLAQRYVDTGAVPVDGLMLVGGEFATVFGSFMAQAEVAAMLADASAAGDPTLLAWSGHASYLLTGESRPYKGSSGTFSRVKPAKKAFTEGAGAWELAARVSAIDLSDGTVAGGELMDVTGGLNWYLNPNTRLMLNVVWADLDTVGSAIITQSRVQVDF